MSKADRPDHPQSSERFNEDNASYTVRGSETPDLEGGVAAIRNVLKTLPARPGVYRMQDSRGDVLYVGKARTLKSRVNSYTQVAKMPKRLQRIKRSSDRSGTCERPVIMTLLHPPRAAVLLHAGERMILAQQDEGEAFVVA